MKLELKTNVGPLALQILFKSATTLFWPLLMANS